MKLVEYERELCKAIESLEHGNVSDAELWLSNFYYKKGRSKPNNYYKILQWTVESAAYQATAPSIKSRIARFYYSVDSYNNQSNAVFVKRTANGYEILKQKSAR